MARTERAYIDLCKKQIEEKFSFGNGQGYTQRDLEVLSATIEEKTGITISLSTLKRLWKNNYKQSPQLASLNALAGILDYKDWHAFKQANQKKSNIFIPHLKWVAPAGLLFMALIWVLTTSVGSINPSEKKDADKSLIITGPVHFEASKTVTSGIPNTVIFKYDVSNVIADTIYIQQSWNKHKRLGIDPEGSAVASIYYESGFHRARLMANDSIIAMLPIHILSNGWEPHVYYSSADPRPIDFKNEKFVTNGRLHLDSAMLSKRYVDFSKDFFSRISNSRIFDVHSDNFSFLTRMKVDSLSDSLCPWMNIVLVTEVHIFSVSLNKNGCEKYVSYKLGEIRKSGSNNDLSALGCQVYDWQELEVRVKDKHAAIYLNGALTYEEQFKEDLGKIKALIYIFDGTGSIDYTRLSDGNGKMVFEDHFGG
ncbi:hypothetical protein QQ020_14625 [Fulvivirgaceae bacterium BMA12]|uniref:Uncharacterized protein n=1 Tax=Agaribacillus aureus TaxID=3051825 RepID=A0ABT8L7V1_9BACT|nr:hypothetical protein [Fulvivirgaceae bacterium BMA12]